MSKTAINTAYLSIFGNLLLACLKGITGFLGNSHALIADAVESLTDVFASVFVLGGLKYASKPADHNHPYGHGKIEPLVTFGVVGFLLIAATLIAYTSIINIQSPQETPASYTLWVLAGIIVFKEVLYRVVKKRSEETNSSSLKAEAVHHRMDAVTSFLAFIGVGLALYMGKGWEVADDWAALTASAIIVLNAYRLFRPALAEIMDEHVYEQFVDEIRMEAVMVEGVIGAEKCIVRKHGMVYHIDLHIIVKGSLSVTEGHDISHKVKDRLRLKLKAIQDVIIHIEPNDEHHLRMIGFER